MKVAVFKEVSFDAAHSLPHLPSTHKCSRLHGHTYHVRIEVTGEVDPSTGWVVDYAEIARFWQPCMNSLDHHCIDGLIRVDGKPVPSTSENLAAWIWGCLDPVLPGLSAVIVRETDTAGAEVRR